MRFLIRPLGAAVLLGALAYCAWTLSQELADVSTGMLLGLLPAFGWACLLSLGNYLLRFWRWHALLRRGGAVLPVVSSLAIYLSGFAFTLSPGKVGELARARHGVRQGVPVALFGLVFVVERCLDVWAVALLCLLGLGQGAHGPLGLLAAGTLVLGALLIPALLWLLPVPTLRWDAGAGRWWQWVCRGTEGVLAFRQRCRVLLAPAVLAPGLLLGVCAWGLEGLGLWCIVEAALPGHMPVLQAVSVYATSLMVGAATFLPGGVGGTEAWLAFTLERGGMALSLALAITALCRIATLWLAIAVGWGAEAWLWIQKRRSDHAPC